MIATTRSENAFILTTTNVYMRTTRRDNAPQGVNAKVCLKRSAREDRMHVHTVCKRDLSTLIATAKANEALI
jgi:hypothetical protein